jgi:hypothetical protein
MYDKEAARAQARASRQEAIRQWDQEDQARATASPPSRESYDSYGAVQAARAEWERSPAIRAEFGEFERYAAFKKAEAKGLVKIISRKA